MNIIDWNIKEICGYEPKTTLYMDFSIADRFGVNAVLDTKERAFEYVKDDHELLTELVMVLNWKIWEHYEKNETLARVYNDLWLEMDEYARKTLKGEELNYFYRTTD